MPVFGLIIAINVLTALLALLVLKRMRSGMGEERLVVRVAE